MFECTQGKLQHRVKIQTKVKNNYENLSNNNSPPIFNFFLTTLLFRDRKQFFVTPKEFSILTFVHFTTGELNQSIKPN